jgi:hypothetical protein
MLFEPGALGRAGDDVGEDRLLQSSALETATDRIGRLGGVSVRQPLQLTCEARGDRLAPGLAAFSGADEQ